MTIAETTHGKVEGVSKLGCLQFRGIPFASVQRWQPPRSVEKWDGVRDATQFGPICPQNVGTMEAMGGVGRAAMPPMSEDCLTLNVWTPAADDARRPTMVWIHGGAFSTGSGRTPWYSGHNFARDGVVVVTVNYRLNAFGFLNFDQLFDGFEGTGTLGIRDQIAALNWVQENIANFGGDPDNVTIFGESAGGMSVGTLLSSPKTKSLFHKAIPQSGAAHNSSSVDSATKIAEQFLDATGVAKGDKAALLALTPEQILEAAQGLVGAGGRLPYQPCIGDDVVPVAPIDASRDGASKTISTLIGTNLEEGKLFTLGMRSFPDTDRELQPAYVKKLGGSPSENDLYSALMTDRVFRIPAIRLAEAPVEAVHPCRCAVVDLRLGACHALEIPFAFDNLSAPGASAFTGGEGPQEIATEMHDAWVAFAKTGDPGWAPYDPASRTTKLFDVPSQVVDDPDGDTRELWDGIL